MRILKIEIQNINSLKCNKPIVIDFRKEQFKDVGLYAITGTTGAGKTTILDAITLSLYHKIPRLNNSSTKVKDVVSYGAKSAYTSVLFENNNTSYEATWTIKMTTVKGVALKSPVEEVRLKNFTTGLIIGEKKKEVQTKIIEIIQLDYDQFLRSVMLAQGDFSSFLSAKGVEKAKLLEQITGEKIYKKIGEATLQKISTAKSKLIEIRSKINDADILSSENKDLLTKESEEITKELAILNKEQDKNVNIKNWYLNYENLNAKKIKFDKDFKVFKQYKQENLGLLEKLEKHKKAIPFKNILREIQRIEKEIKTKKELLDKTELELKSQLSLIDNCIKEEFKLKKNVEEKEKIIAVWLPKLENISKLDENIKNEKVNNKEIRSQLDKIDEAIKKLKETYKYTTENYNKKQKEIEILETELSNNKQILNIEKHYTNWNNKLSVINRNFTESEIENNLLKKLQKEKIELQQELVVDNKKYKELQKENLEKTKKQNTLLQFLKDHNLESLQHKKTELITKGTNWNLLEKLSKDYLEKLKINTKINIVELEKTKKLLESDLKTIDKELKIASVNFKDYETIHIQNVKIQSLENERKLLQKGEPCKLCGSKEHPLISHYNTIKISDSEQELKKRKDILEKHQKNQQYKTLSLTKISTEIDSAKKLIDLGKKELISIQTQVKELNLDASIDDVKTIKTTLQNIRLDYQNIEQLIKKTTNKTKEKDLLLDRISKDNSIISGLEKKLSVTDEKLKNNESKQETIKSKLLKYINENKLLENELKPQLKENKLVFPDINQVDSFVEKLKKDIDTYNQQLKKLQDLKSKQSVLNVEITTNKKTTEEKKKEQSILSERQFNINESIDKLAQKRNKLLDISISVKDKRNEITVDLKLSQENLESKTSELSKLKKKKTELKSNKATYKDSIKVKSLEFKKSNILFNNNLKESDFNSKEVVLNALLSDDEFKKLEKLENKLKEEDVKFTSTNKILKQDELELTKSKDFKISFDEVNKNIELNKKNIENKSARKGEILEKLKKNSEILKRNNKVFQQIEKQENILQKWRTLMDVIGGNQNAFNNYVQRLTLQNLIGLANIHLKKLNKRYSLQIKKGYNLKKDDFLNFELIDHFQIDEVRDVDTSSGGEKFLISLSLALGLSDLASQNVQIDSLFIDEGFGSLDNNTLETVISALETLQNQGKIIGVISHVESLKERISTQINVVKKNNGVSTVEIV